MTTDPRLVKQKATPTPSTPPTPPTTVVTSPPAIGARKRHPIDRFLGQRVTVQASNGTLIEGTFVEREEGIGVFQDVTITGTKHTAKAAQLLLWLSGQNISHVNTIPIELVKLLP